MVGISLRRNVILAIGATLFLMLLTALANLWTVFAYVMVLNLSLWLVLGAMRGENELGPAKWLGLASFVIWVVCLTAIFHYWNVFKGRMPDFTIAGMHPGFFVLFPVMWLLSFIPVTLSYALLFDRWVLSEEGWREYLRKIGKEPEVER